MKHVLLALAALSLVACGQTTAVDEPARAPAPAPVDVAQATGGECTVMTGPGPAVGLESHGTASGYAVSSTPGVLACSEPGLEGAVECAFTGPGQALVVGATTTGYTLSAGQTATLIVGPNGPSCHLNASGE